MMREPETTRNLLAKVHERVSQIVCAGDVVVDATIGNGYDTLFLAQCVGVGGRVVGFDVQAEALESTRKRLLDAEVEPSRFQLHQKCHSQMGDVVDGEVSAVIFNLGYLPGADKSLITRMKTTLAALRQAVSLLRPGGILSVMCYPGHSGGDIESVAVVQWMEEVEQSHAGGATVTCYQREAGDAESPFLMVALL